MAATLQLGLFSLLGFLAHASVTPCVRHSCAWPLRIVSRVVVGPVMRPISYRAHAPRGRARGSADGG